MVDNSNSHVCAPLFVQTSIFESAHMMDSTKLSNHHGNPIVTRSGFNGHSATHLLYLGVYANKRCTNMWIKIVYNFVDSCQESKKLFIRAQVKKTFSQFITELLFSIWQKSKNRTWITKMSLNHYRFDLICSKFKYSSALFNITLFLVHVKCVVTWFI